jgi:hypothetical protein
MDVIDLSTSRPHDMHFVMQDLFETNPEGWAAIRGMMTILALPAVRCCDGTSRRPRVEVFVDGEWHVIDEVAIEPDAVTFAHGKNGKRVEWRFDPRKNVPRWRPVRPDCGVHHRFDFGGE